MKMAKNGIQARLSGLCENRLSQLRSQIQTLAIPGMTSAKGALEALIAVGDLEEALSRLDSLGVSVAQWRKEAAELTARLDSTVKSRDDRVLAALSEAITHTADLLKRQPEEETAESAELRNWTPFGGFTEFDQFLWGLDAGQYVRRAIGLLKWPVDPTPWSQLGAERRHELESLIPKVVEKLMQVSDAENPQFDPPDFFPAHFWWRTLAWAASQRR